MILVPTAETAEPIEVVITLAALVALLVGIYLAHQAFQIMHTVRTKSALIREISWLRMRNELIGVAIAGLVMWWGWIQLTTLPLPTPSAAGIPSQVILTAIAALSLLRSLVTAVSGRRIVRMIERGGSVS